MLIQRTPRSQVRPSDICAHDIHIIGFFHNAIVDRDAPALGVCPSDKALLLSCSEELSAFIECCKHIRKMLFKRCQYALHVPDEDPGIPVKIAALNEFPCKLNIGFFGECLNL